MSDLTIDEDGNVVVADTGNNRIQQFALDGTFKRAIGRAGTAVGQFDSPIGVAVNALGVLIVADAGNDRIQQLDLKRAAGE